MILALILLSETVFGNPPTEADRRALPRTTTGMCALVQRRNLGGSGTARRNVADNRWISSRLDSRLSAGGSGS